jgi:Flp pilus assembly protein TadG
MNNVTGHARGLIMKSKIPRKIPMTRLNDQQGVVAVTVALVMVVMLAMTALALDVGHALVARNQLQNASDAAALAGARALGVIYGGMTGSLTGYTLTSGDVGNIVSAASVAGADNQAAGVTVTVNSADISVGIWNSATRTFTPTTVLPRAVRVITRRDGTANGPISTFLANVIGFSNVSVTAVATAQLNPASVMAPGDMDAPFGISEFYFNSGFGCGSTIQFSPSVPGNPQTCAGWTTYDQNFNANNMRSIIEGMTNGTYTPPGAQAGQTSLEFGNGNIASAWSDMVTLWQTRVSQYGAWDANVPVYAGDDCSPNGPKPIIGFATVRITYVGVPGDANNSTYCTGGNTSTGCMAGVIQCDVFEGSGGSGGTGFGTFGTIPGLVE